MLSGQTSAQSHRKRYFHKEGQPSRLTGKAKHPPKVNTWAGISSQGATSTVIFTGILTATRYNDISRKILTLATASSRTTTPSTQVNGAKTTFKKDRFRTPASSPDLNPIKNVWGSLKEYLRSRVKPRNISDLKVEFVAFGRHSHQLYVKSTVDI